MACSVATQLLPMCRGIFKVVQTVRNLHLLSSKSFLVAAVLHCLAQLAYYWSSCFRQPLLQQQQQQMMLAAPQNNYLASRNQALHEVESAIRDIGGIFQQLAHMVSSVSTVSVSLKRYTAVKHQAMTATLLHIQSVDAHAG